MSNPKRKDEANEKYIAWLSHIFAPFENECAGIFHCGRRFYTLRKQSQKRYEKVSR